jgi:hypothetical protein
MCDFVFSNTGASANAIRELVAYRVALPDLLFDVKAVVQHHPELATIKEYALTWDDKVDGKAYFGKEFAFRMYIEEYAAKFVKAPRFPQTGAIFSMYETIGVSETRTDMRGVQRMMSLRAVCKAFRDTIDSSAFLHQRFVHGIFCALLRISIQEREQNEYTSVFVANNIYTDASMAMDYALRRSAGEARMLLQMQRFDCVPPAGALRLVSAVCNDIRAYAVLRFDHTLKKVEVIRKLSVWTASGRTVPTLWHATKKLQLPPAEEQLPVALRKQQRS